MLCFYVLSGGGGAGGRGGGVTVQTQRCVQMFRPGGPVSGPLRWCDRSSCRGGGGGVGGRPSTPSFESLFLSPMWMSPKKITVISKINVTVSQKPSAINNRQVMSLHCIYMYIHKELGLLYICTQVYIWLSFSINLTIHSLFFFSIPRRKKRTYQK